MTTSISGVAVASIIGMKKTPDCPTLDGSAHSARVPGQFDSSSEGGRTATTPGPAATLVPMVTNRSMGWLTINEAAALIRVPKSWLYERTRTNTIPHLKLGKYLRFDPKDLVAWTRQFHRDGRGRGPQPFGNRGTRRKGQNAALGLKVQDGHDEQFHVA